MANKTSLHAPEIQQKLDFSEITEKLGDPNGEKNVNVVSFLEYRKRIEAEEKSSVYRKILSLVSHLIK